MVTVTETIILPRISMKPKLPFRFLWATLLIALVWFIIMFMYIDDLMKDENKESHVHTSERSRVHSDKWVKYKSKFRDHLRKREPQKIPSQYLHSNIPSINYDDEEEEEDTSPGNFSQYIDDEDVEKYVLTQRSGIRIHRIPAKQTPKRVSRPLKRSRVVHVMNANSSETKKLDKNNQVVWQGSSRIARVGPQGSASHQLHAQQPQRRVPNEGIILDRSNIMAQVNSQIQEMEQKEKLSQNATLNSGKDLLHPSNNLGTRAKVSENKPTEKKLYTLSEINFPRRKTTYKKYPANKKNQRYKYGALQKTTFQFQHDKQRLMTQRQNGTKATDSRSFKPSDMYIQERTLTPDDVLDIKDSHNRHSFNVAASEKLSLDRPVPATRPSSCDILDKAVNATQRVEVSIIICFHNEAWMTLLRTVHSVLNRTPPLLLHQLILIDDYSTHDYLGGKLEDHLKGLPKVTLLRTSKREGLARARLKGVSYATGDIIVFLDSHCECNENWLPPLVQAIQRDRTKMVCPQVDIIDYETFEYQAAPTGLLGSFNWKLHFAWKKIPEHEAARRKAETDPIRTPAMVGGLFAVDRLYFMQLGGLDPGMEIWGSENIELSFRIWMCGGSIEILPCSRVGHVFRPVIPYGFPRGPRLTLHHNAMRVAEVWMDQYKAIYYASQDFPPDPAVLPSIKERLNLRQQLKCQDFTWYLGNVAPEIDVPPRNAQYFGQLKNDHAKWCLTTIGGSSVLLANTCEDSKNYLFTLTSGGDLIYNNMCVTMDTRNMSLYFTSCNKHITQWTMRKTNQLQGSSSLTSSAVSTTNINTSQQRANTSHSNASSKAFQASSPPPSTILCLDLSHRVVNQVTMATCDTRSPTQRWTFSYKFDVQRMQTNYP